jgi:hypothetical protein
MFSIMSGGASPRAVTLEKDSLPMHFHFDFSAAQILWTLTFAAELVLLVVLLGRDRARRYPWFTLKIALLALLLLISRLIVNRMAAVAVGIVFLTLSCIATLVSWIVVAEVARRGFAGASRRSWLIAAIAALVIAGVALWLWGPWPAWKTLTGASRLVAIRCMQMFADKGSMLANVLEVELAVLLALFGRRYQGGWRSHPHMIAIGLSAAALSQIAVRVIWRSLTSHAVIRSQAEYLRIVTLRERIYHANDVVYLCALVWWIAWLWLDEPATANRQIAPGA